MSVSFSAQRELTETVAAEILSGFDLYDGPRWHKPEGEAHERAVRVSVISTSLMGRLVEEVSELGKDGLLTGLYGSESGSSAFLGSLLLVEPMDEDGIYTGEVLVREASDDYRQ